MSLQPSAMLMMLSNTSNLTTIGWSCFAKAQRSKKMIFKSTRRLKLSVKQFRMSRNELLNKR